MAGENADPIDIRNWQRRDDGITTSGRLEAGDIPRLAAIGVRHVINLALDDHPEALRDEAELLRQAGIEYSHIPVPFAKPEMAHVEELRRAIASSPGPVHIHCIMNYRVTAFLYLLDRENGIAPADAHARMAQIWDPLSSDEPMAQPWKELISG